LLPRAVHERGIKLVLVSDIIELYCDPDLRYSRSLDLFKATFNSLVTMARAERAIVLTTSLGETTSGPFLYAARQRADVVLRFEERYRFTKLTLEKHPTRSVESLAIKQSTPRVLEEFLEVDEGG
jgi:hypothetical protein